MACASLHLLLARPQPSFLLTHFPSTPHPTPDLLPQRSSHFTGLLGSLSTLGWRVDKGKKLEFSKFASQVSSIASYPNAKNSPAVGLSCKHLASAVYKAASAGKFPLILGGDHSVGIGSLAGILRARPDCKVIWVDAHADLNTPTMSPSGNMHGMPVGLLLEEMNVDHDKIAGLEWLARDWKGDEVWPAYGEGERPPRLAKDNIVYVGLRDVDSEERKAIRDLRIKHFTMYDIDNVGIGRVMQMAIDYLGGEGSSSPIHLSYDIDAVDPESAPATGTRVRGGLTYREAHFVAERVYNCGRLGSADLVELNPSLSDEAGASETVELGMQIITSMMGKSII